MLHSTSGHNSVPDYAKPRKTPSHHNSEFLAQSPQHWVPPSSASDIKLRRPRVAWTANKVTQMSFLYIQIFALDYSIYGQHSDVIASTAASQQEGSGFKAACRPVTFLYGDCTFSLWLFGFPLRGFLLEYKDMWIRSNWLRKLAHRYEWKKCKLKKGKLWCNFMTKWNFEDQILMIRNNMQVI